MAGPIPVLIECIAPDLKPEIALDTLKGFTVVIEGFFGMLPAIFDIKNLPKLAPPKLPNFMFDAFTAGFDKKSFPAFGLNIGGIDLNFDGIKVDLFDVGTFNFPELKGTGLLGLIGGLLSVGFKLPSLFFDFDKKIPKFPVDIELAIEDLIKINFGLISLPEGSLPEGFGIKIAKCLVTAITSIAPKP